MESLFRKIEDFVRKFIFFEEEDELDSETWTYFCDDNEDDDDDLW